MEKKTCTHNENRSQAVRKTVCRSPFISERSEPVCSVRLAKIFLFNSVLDSVVKHTIAWFESIRYPCKDFPVLRSSTKMSINRIREKATAVVLRYPKDMGEELDGKLQSLKPICLVNSYEKIFLPWDFLNYVKTLNLETLFFNLNVTFRIFPMTPVTVICAHKATSQTKRIENALRTTVCQDRLSSLRVLPIKTEFAKKHQLA